VNRRPQGPPPDGRSRLDAVVAGATATVFGVLAMVLAGATVFVSTVLVAPGLAPVPPAAGALAGVWLAARRTGSARGFGVGLVTGWVLLALWTSGASLGLYGLR
jgi:hypothetical protein